MLGSSKTQSAHRFYQLSKRIWGPPVQDETVRYNASGATSPGHLSFGYQDWDWDWDSLGASTWRVKYGVHSSLRFGGAVGHSASGPSHIR